MEICLRTWRLADAADLAAGLNNKNVLNNLRDGLPFPYTEQAVREYITAMLAADKDNTFAYAITADDRAVGSIGAFRQGNIHRQTAELGYYLAEEYWGRGIMTQAIRQLCGHLFATTDLVRIYATPFSHNIGSRRALEKAGFTREGTMKYSAVKNGKLLDMTLYSLTRCPELYPVTRLSPEEIPAALKLCWRVFSASYGPEGLAAFRASLADEARIRQMHFYGAYDAGRLVGVLGMRAPQHIGYFFVEPALQGRGIGKKLFTAMRQDYDRQVFTVHSAPRAVEIYRRLGFRPTDAEQCADGLRYTPMRFDAAP